MDPNLFPWNGHKYPASYEAAKFSLRISQLNSTKTSTFSHKYSNFFIMKYHFQMKQSVNKEK